MRPPVPAGVLSDNKLDETENGMPALVDEGGQPPTKGDATAAAPTPDSLESPSAQEVMEAKEGETTLEPATADQAAVSFELDKDAPSGERHTDFRWRWN